MARKAKAEGGRPAISQSELRALMASERSAKNDIAEITDSLSTQIKSAVDNNYLNKKVFSTICKLDRLEPETLHFWLEDFEHYLDISGLRQRADSAPALALAPRMTKAMRGTARSGRNVKPFPAPSSVAAE